MTQKMKRIFSVISGVMMFGALCLAPMGANAAGILPEPTGKCPENYQNGTQATLGTPCANGAERDYSLDDIKSLLAKIGNFMIGISGAIVLFCFVLGGFFWIASAGNPKMVDKGKGLISGAVIGLIILVSAYTVVTFAVKTLTGTDSYNPAAVGPANPAGVPNGPVSQNATIIKGNITKMPAMIDLSKLCKSLTGTECVAMNDCKTPFAISNACGTDAVTGAGQECCMPVKQAGQSTPCGKMGGTCQNVSKPCTGPYVAGFCGGDSATQCCFK